ncbi:MAG: DUF1835 domain-containing protein [Bacteroidetes bacterium]|nr:MAG: DUF1835 domain-containing protein [Bacteroidota bacterium]
MPDLIHILNGDALAEQFPAGLPGTRLVNRECLVEGPVAGDTLPVFWANRARYLSATYPDTPEAHYQEAVAPAFRQMQALPASVDISLWFEDDLFCQVNLWFVAHLLLTAHPGRTLWLVRPPVHTPYGFGGLSPDALHAAHAARRVLPAEIAALWPAYQARDVTALPQAAAALPDDFAFISAAVQAHIERLPRGDDPGRPIKALRRIMTRLGTEAFGPVFQAFCAEEAIYGFGDLQVHRLWEEARG